MEYKFGFPVATCANFREVIDQLGVRPWPHIAEPQKLEDYLNKARQPDYSDKYIPKTQVVFLRDPNGDVFKGFRMPVNNAAVVFTLLPGDYVPVCVEYKHGMDEICIDLPGGAIDPGESAAACAQREFTEETGILLESVIPVGGSRGSAFDPRFTDGRHRVFLGVSKNPVEKIKTSHDAHEFIAVILFSLKEWLAMVDQTLIGSAYSIVATFQSLRYLKRI